MNTPNGIYYVLFISFYIIDNLHLIDGLGHTVVLTPTVQLRSGTVFGYEEFSIKSEISYIDFYVTRVTE